MGCFVSVLDIPGFVCAAGFLIVRCDSAGVAGPFWLIQVAWVVLGAMMIVADFVPGWS